MRAITMLCGGLALAAATAASAQTTDPAAARNAENWAVFQKLYPARAIAAREEGAVGFDVTFDSKGEVVGCKVTRSSGHPLLDAETCQIITLNAVFKPDPTVGASQTKTSAGMIVWKLPNSTAVIAAPRAVAANAAPEKTVCKKTVRTGTLAGFERTCMTPTEWAKQSDESKQPWEEVQGRKGSTSGN